LHAIELPVDEETVRRLLREQFPHWAGLAIRRVPSSGTINAIFRLGEDLAVRAPFVPGEEGILREAEWLPRLARLLPVRVPRVVGVGEADDGYPSPWLVVDWIPGTNPEPGGLIDPERVTSQLVAFIRALRVIDATGAPAAYRSRGLPREDAAVRENLARISEVDTRRLLGIWDEALAAAPWPHAPVWVHGDILPSNVLVDAEGGLAAVIDFAPGVADPAVELIAAWNLVPAEHRDAFRAALEVDDDTWARGRGWAVVQAAVALPYYRDINPGMTAMALYALRQLEAG
jgi:aminoglycoside phosphotransferase (APT) family kinase protein